MINFKITSLDSGFLTIEKPTGKSIPLKLGEIVKAEVMDILPTGGVTLKIKGDFITAKTEISLEKGAMAFFKVADLPVDGRELRLQFMGYTNEPAKGQGTPESSFNLKESALPRLMQELTNSLSGIKKLAASGKEADTYIAKLQNLNTQILKALPPDINSLPKDIRMQLQNLLQASLKATGESIQTRLDNFINQLPAEIKNHPLVENIKKDLMVSIEKLLQTPMKSVLQDTGVVLEAKLKAIAGLFQQIEQFDNLKSSGEKQETATIPLNKGATASESKQNLIQHDTTAIKKDLKAGLLQLKQLLAGESQSERVEAAGKGMANIELRAPNSELLTRIDGLLKDIETFQVLSKTTDSFYTFLPLSWKELRDGEIAFRRGQSDSKGTSYSCRINLDLEQFGKLTIMVLMYNREFLVSFTAENPTLQENLANNTDILQESFNARGLNIKAINVMDRSNASLEQLERLESSEKTISIKA